MRHANVAEVSVRSIASYGINRPGAEMNDQKFFQNEAPWLVCQYKGWNHYTERLLLVILRECYACLHSDSEIEEQVFDQRFHQSVPFNKQLLNGELESRAIAGRTARCRRKFR